MPQIEARFDKANPTMGHISEQQNAPADGRCISALTGAGRWSTLPRGQTQVSAAILGSVVSAALLPLAEARLC